MGREKGKMVFERAEQAGADDHSLAGWDAKGERRSMRKQNEQADDDHSHPGWDARRETVSGTTARAGS